MSERCQCGVNSARRRDHKYPCPLSGITPEPITWWHVNYESDYVALYRCSRCAALAILEDRQHHEDWHFLINEGK